MNFVKDTGINHQNLEKPLKLLFVYHVLQMFVDNVNGTSQIKLINALNVQKEAIMIQFCKIAELFAKSLLIKSKCFL